MPTPQGFPGSQLEDVSRFNFSPQGFKQYAFNDPVNFYRVFLLNVHCIAWYVNKNGGRTV